MSLEKSEKLTRQEYSAMVALLNIGLKTSLAQAGIEATYKSYERVTSIIKKIESFVDDPESLDQKPLNE